MLGCFPTDTPRVRAGGNVTYHLRTACRPLPCRQRVFALTTGRSKTPKNQKSCHEHHGLLRANGSTFCEVYACRGISYIILHTDIYGILPALSLAHLRPREALLTTTTYVPDSSHGMELESKAAQRVRAHKVTTMSAPVLSAWLYHAGGDAVRT